MAIIESIMKEFTENNEVVTESTVAIDNKSSAIVAVSLDTSARFTNTRLHEIIRRNIKCT